MYLVIYNNDCRYSVVVEPERFIRNDKRLEEEKIIFK